MVNIERMLVLFLLLGWGLGCTAESDSPDAVMGTGDVQAIADLVGADDAGSTAILFGPSVAKMPKATPLWTTTGLFDTTDDALSVIVGAGSIQEPVAAASVAGAGGPELFLVVGELFGTQLIAATGQLQSAWTFEDSGARIHRPAVWKDRLLICTQSQEEATAHWVRRSDGEVLATVALGAGPVTSPARVFSGGSHWLVGVGSRIVGVTIADPLAESGVVMQVTAELDLAPAQVTSVVTTGGWLFGAALWSDGESPDNQAFGDALYLGGITEKSGQELSFIEMGFSNPVPTPGWMWAAPVVVTKLPTCDEVDCVAIQDVLFSGGSHWLGGWDVDGGKPLWVNEDLPERVTGLAVGGDGVVYSGGSHWLPDQEKLGWTVRGTKTLPSDDHFVGEEVWVESGGENVLVAGIPSPIVAEKELHVVVVPAVGAATATTMAISSAGPHLCGWSRAYGDLANAGMPMISDVGVCFGE